MARTYRQSAAAAARRLDVAAGVYLFLLAVVTLLGLGGAAVGFAHTDGHARVVIVISAVAGLAAALVLSLVGLWAQAFARDIEARNG